MKIRPGETAPCELVNKNGVIIAEGTHNHCLTVMNAIIEEFDNVIICCHADVETDVNHAIIAIEVNK